MTHSLRFCFVLHNHQPIGNFDDVFEGAYRDSYQPFLDVYSDYPELPLSLHLSGPLLDWLDEKHPEYLDRVAELVSAGRVEILGGPYYEAILTMIPPRDRRGQIRAYQDRLANRLGAEVRGVWMPERVWEAALVRDLARAGVEYTLLDDFHFKHAGLVDEQLRGYYLTEDDGHVLGVFPGSEQLRYLIPFANPEDTINYFRAVANEHPQAVMVFGDDGEKFGSWPHTRKHVYEDGWLRSFLDALQANRDWIHMTTLRQAFDEVPPEGKVYLPDASYREMTEWALPESRQLELEQVTHELAHHPCWPRMQRFVRGGFWRNFRVKYPEANEMYARMMMISEQIEEARAVPGDPEREMALRDAQQALYRGQCNCAYWHGAFGGIYLPHLRNAVYRELIDAEHHLHRAIGRTGPWVDAEVADYNFDARQEILLASDSAALFFAPAAGGQLYELDVRVIRRNLLATMTRRPEAYHQRVRAGAEPSHDGVASIHDRVIFKQEGLDGRLQYDRHPRKSLLDHFFDEGVQLEQVVAGDFEERGDFVDGAFEATIRRSAERIQVHQVRQGRSFGVPLKLTKAVTAIAGSDVLEISYLLEGIPEDAQWGFGIEFNFAGLPAGADDRYFFQGEADNLGPLQTRLDLPPAMDLGLRDEWLGIGVHLAANRPSGWWTFPIETVSQSEAGFELVHQSVMVQPHWIIEADREGKWGVQFRLAFETGRNSAETAPLSSAATS